MSRETDAILKQIAAIRSRMDPDALNKVEAVVRPLVDQGAFDKGLGDGGRGTGGPGKGGPGNPSGNVAYDRKTALSAVKVFLESRNDGGNFKRRLASALKSKTH